MELPAPDTVKKVCAKFRIDWNKGSKPRIIDLLEGIQEPVRGELMASLIAIEIELRADAGEFPCAQDYVVIGSDAVAMAKQSLEGSAASLPKPVDETTAFFSVDALGDKNETLSFDEVTPDEDTLFKDSSGAVRPDDEFKFIGRYKLLQQIGVGGMGAVWMAEQYEPVKRRVALKVIRADMGTKSAVARFEAERQACAMMDHQNIAKILDAGTTETGNPYFVMELVRGIPLNKYCDKHRLDIRKRLQLMIPVCRAVQHAHQKGIIHRDLKHSNVLVTEYDGDPVPKVIDFGLAKALGHQDTLTEKTMFTEIGKVVGTLQYMSPEQTETNNLDVDTRSDVYSLGVMVYKLLVGATPLDDGAHVQKSLLDALKLIREKDPARPSVRISVSEESTKILCALRTVQPDKLKQILVGDLDWIVMKALEKDRKDRYQTANDLAMELERYLNDEQVLARPPSAIYSLKKFVKRNRGLVAFILATSFLLIAGIMATSTATWFAIRESNRANYESFLAGEESKKARLAEAEAQTSEKLRKIELLAQKLKSAWSNWRLGDAEPAWQLLNLLSKAEDGWESRYLRSEFSSSDETLYGHSDDVVSIDSSDNGKYIVTAANDNSIKVWDADSKKLLYTQLLDDQPTSVRFSPKSKLIACSTRANKIRLWHAATGKRYQTFGPYSTDITCIDFSPDGRLLFAGAAEKDSIGNGDDREYLESDSASTIRVVSVEKGTVLQTLEGHTQDIMSINCSPDGNTIASGSLDKSIRVWKKTGEEFSLSYVLDKHFLGVTSVSIDASGKQLLSGSHDTTIRLWELETGELFRTFIGHTNRVNSARFSEQGDRIVSASTDRTARIWNMTGEEILTCQGHFDSIRDATFSQDGQQILTASKDNTVRVWDSKKRPSTVTVREGVKTIWSADFSTDGRTVARGSDDGTIVIINADSGEIIHTIGQPGDPAILSLAFSPDSKYLAAGDAVEKDVDDKKEEEGGEREVYSRLRIWNAKNFELVKTIDAHTGFIWDVSFSMAGDFLMTASADSTATVWETKNWSPVATLKGHASEVASARFSRNGQLIVTASDDRTIKLWNANSYELIKTFEGHRNSVWKAIFSPSGDSIASSSYDGEIIIWNVVTKEKLQRFQAHTNQIAGLTFSKNGSRLVSASDDKTIKIWDVQSAIEMFVLRDKDDALITHVSFSRNGDKLVSGTSNGRVTIRAVSKTNALSQPFLPQDAEKMSIDGLRFVTSRNVAMEDLKREFKYAEKCCKYFPSYKTFTNLGIAQYRLGKFQEAIENLTEADRLEPIQYGEPDEPPNIEAFLAMSLFQSNRLAKADEFRAEFQSKVDENWVGDEKMTALVEEIEDVFGMVD